MTRGSDDAWTSLMDIENLARPKFVSNDNEKDKKGKKGKKDKEDKLKNPVEKYDVPVSRFGALLAAALLRLPGDTYYQLHQKCVLVLQH